MCAVTSTVFPCASKYPSRFAIVCVLPVPGGPCTSTAFACASRAAISYCSALAGLLKRMSGSGPAAVRRASPSPLPLGGGSASSVSIPTMRDNPLGASVSSSSKSSMMLSNVVLNPAVRGRRKITGSRQMLGCFAEIARVFSSKNSPSLNRPCTRERKNPSALSPPSGSTGCDSNSLSK